MWKPRPSFLWLRGLTPHSDFCNGAIVTELQSQQAKTGLKISFIFISAMGFLGVSTLEVAQFFIL